MRWLHTTAGVIGWACLIAWLGGTAGAWDFRICLKAPAGACSKTPAVAPVKQPERDRSNDD